MLLLDPAQLGVAIMLGHLNTTLEPQVSRHSHLLHHIKWEGADLLDGVNGNLVLEASVSPLFQKVVEDFPSAKQNLQNSLVNSQ